METNKQGQAPNPRAKANLLSIMFFWWLHPFFRLGYKKDLNVNDLYQILDEDKSERLGEKLEREWNKELVGFNTKSTSRKKIKPSFTKALWRCFGKDFMFFGILAFIEECILKIGQPLCLGKLVLYFADGGLISEWEAYLYATGVILGSAIFTFTHHPYFFGVQHSGMKMRVASCSLVYKKCLKLSQKSLGETTIGQMVNLLSNDVNRFDLSVLFVHYLWVGPLQMVISFAILYAAIGPSCLAGFGVLVLFIPFQGWLGKVFSQLRLKTAKRTDERIRIMNEIISGMRVIKMYTWEMPFAKIIEVCRRKEVDVIRKSAFFRALNMSLFFTSSKLIVFLTFLVYILTNNILTSEKVFLTVSLYNNIRLIMTMFFPSAISIAAETQISIKRIQKFLLLDEKPASVQPTTAIPLNECGIWMENLTAKWPAANEQDDNTLTDLTFSVKPGEIMAVIGQVGAGKGSLLQVILGELLPKSGNVQVKGRIAYASQEAWVFSGTVRQNILCGKDYDAKRYKKVIKVCALDKDLSLLPEGDKTSVGDKGVSLSGGQKARVNLARALYADADIYLLDDPLSAVDTHVGKHLFNECIMGYLRKKVRILVTHQLQFLKDVNNILLLKQGRIDALGTFQQLMTSGVDFARLLTLEGEAAPETGDRLTESEGDAFAVRNGSISGSGIRGRLGSTLSKSSVKSMSEAEEQAAIPEEMRSTGKVAWNIYWQYFRAAGGCFAMFISFVTTMITQVLFSGSDYWLSVWTDAEEWRAHKKNVVNDTDPTPLPNPIDDDDLYYEELFNTTWNNNETISTDIHPWWENIDTMTSVYIYTILVGGLFVFSLVRTIIFFHMCMTSSVNLHNKMFKSIIRAPVQFFDTNPVGRTLNRFAKDIGCIDEVLPPALFDVIVIFLSLVGGLILVGMVNGWLLTPIVFLTFIFYYFRKFYLETARDVKRLEAITRSPVFSHLSSSLLGLTTLRAHRVEKEFQFYFDEYQDIHSSAWYMFLATTRWFGIWLDWICVAYVVCVTYGCVLLRQYLTSSSAGLAISSAMALTGAFQWGVRQSAEVENQMTSVERVIEYSRLPSEAPLESSTEKKPLAIWPQHGRIEFKSMSLRYAENDPPVLKNISCVIKPQEKIGIVGRTGAGKSSLIASLFRLTEPEGNINIDGVDSKSLGLHELRSKISIIPQDPVLFTGTLRRNLDPFNEFTDDALWNTLEEVKLKEAVADLTAGLESIMAEGGTNFSVGQRQLICLARAILRKNKILVLDEATANVDPRTDSFIQETIRMKFCDCTVLTIAHRLNTIMDSDRVMVLDTGYLKEFDEPAVLLENPKTIFYGLVEQTGETNMEMLKEIARQAAQQRRSKLAPQYNNSELTDDNAKTIDTEKNDQPWEKL